MYTQTFVQISNNVRVEVRPAYLEEESEPHFSKHVFGYFIEIHNQGSEPLRLVKRHWEIEDTSEGQFEVDGDGVVGQRPRIMPGDAHRYSSYCVLKSFTGSMRGHYLMERDDGDSLRVAIPEFLLHSHLLN
ncbi:MAG: Co2+/Mg2+ efflux protein ApaG [Balneolaceae bacterium]|nr:Co2+/Mg2+ efflux protein ApaG [Balneolaceae bacterium]